MIILLSVSTCPPAASISLQCNTCSSATSTAPPVSPCSRESPFPSRSRSFSLSHSPLFSAHGDVRRKYLSLKCVLSILIASYTPELKSPLCASRSACRGRGAQVAGHQTPSLRTSSLQPVPPMPPNPQPQRTAAQVAAPATGWHSSWLLNLREPSSGACWSSQP